jgi:hypothetical protein
MFALMELYGAGINDIVMKHEEDEMSSSAVCGEKSRRMKVQLCA